MLFFCIPKYKYLLGNSYSHTKAIPSKCHSTQSITIHLIAPKEGGSKGDSPDAMKYEFPTWASVFVVSWFNKSNHRVSVSLCLIIQFTLTSVAMFDLKYLAINLPGYVIWRHKFFQSKPRCATKWQIRGGFPNQNYSSRQILFVCFWMYCNKANPIWTFQLKFQNFQHKGLGIPSQHFDQCTDLFTNCQRPKLFWQNTFKFYFCC